MSSARFSYGHYMLNLAGGNQFEWRIKMRCVVAGTRLKWAGARITLRPEGAGPLPEWFGSDNFAQARSGGNAGAIWPARVRARRGGGLELLPRKLRLLRHAPR